MWIKFPVKIPAILKKFLTGLHFSMPAKEKVLYLTFDDGPLPSLCPWILSCLKEQQAKATFFLVGENVLRNPELVKQILEEGHSIGNHTQNHLNGFKTTTTEYIQNMQRCAASLSAYLKPYAAPMFRPPYGRIRPAQIREIKKAGYEIVMWDVLSKDYEPGISAAELTGNVLRNSRPGSILVFHDNLKAEQILRATLPGILTELKNRGYRFEALHFSEIPNVQG